MGVIVPLVEPEELSALIRRALREDLGPGDLTTDWLIPPEARGRAVIVTRKTGIACGLNVAGLVFSSVDPGTILAASVAEGERVAEGQELARVEGSLAAILKGERVALNFVQRLSGIATRTAKLVVLLGGTKARLIDTRKTTPGLRALEKYAVRVGGGANHRFGLFDGVLIKDNHIKAAGGITRAVALLRARVPHTVKIEVEVENLAELGEALAAGADVVMLDNMSVAEMARAVRLVGGRIPLEASGGIDDQNIAAVAATGVDLISVGALTHTIQPLDVSLEVL
ncbi:MAG: carboxylating nicotinate-nucleotide diphosphorylase [Firmicutes bacterium]|nr:carboxylating nicotinate-nucleotide diphosphorylase [Bacillota bacterium]